VECGQVVAVSLWVPDTSMMETLDPSERLAFEGHCLACERCASIVAGADEYIRSMRAALQQLQAEEKDSTATRRTGGADYRRFRSAYRFLRTLGFAASASHPHEVRVQLLQPLKFLLHWVWVRLFTAGTAPCGRSSPSPRRP
jgi:anti-sigma factor RsiW